MTDKPPVPPANQSPYPIEEPPHPHAAETPSASAASDDDDGGSGPPTGLIVGALAAVAAVGVGLAATLLRRPEKSKVKPKRSRRSKG